MAKAIFHPQAWLNDWATDVDPEGPTDYEVGGVPGDMEDNSYASDRLRDHDNAPDWVKEWSGPFWVEIVRVV